MLDRESQGFDLQKVWLTQQPIEINTKGMSGQLGIQTSAQTPKGVGMILLNVELLRELPINGFDDLPDRVVDLLSSSRHLRFLITTWDGMQT